MEPEAGLVERGEPDALAEPLAGDVSCGGYGPGAAGSVLACCATPRAVVGVGVAAVLASAAAGRVSLGGAVRVAVARSVGFGEPEGYGIGEYVGDPPAGIYRWCVPEQQVARPELRLPDVIGDLGDELRAETEAAVLLVLWILADYETSPSRCPSGLSCSTTLAMVTTLCRGRCPARVVRSASPTGRRFRCRSPPAV